ncbi:MAG TPA: methyltransferase domain-containing protein [Nitrososphaeraceae archaeon]|jgi:ubiquinone/menaquinone biosynthesis C-methylase UbiE|nr:methyltransferase domain-containing protein [Nitrososphaeraceae archaeon]
MSKSSSSSSSHDSEDEEYKKRSQQRQSWDNVARGWQKCWKSFEKDAQKVNERLVELAEIKQGDRIIDIATGIGEPAITAAKKVGVEGYVLATDISSQMLAIAKERTVSLGLQNIVEFKEVDAEKILDLQQQQQQQQQQPLSPFAAVLCRWGLMFFPNLASTLTNIYKILSSGGRIAAAVWSEPAKVPKLYTAIDIVTQKLGISSTTAYAHYPEILSPFSLANINIVNNALVEAGFKDIHTEYLNITFEFLSAEDYTDFAKQIIAPIHNLLANETENRKEEIWKAVSEEVARRYYIDDNNSTGSVVRMDNECIIIVGRK